MIPFFFLEAHWLFAAQYLDVSELLAQVTHQKIICNKKCRKITTAVMTLLIGLNVLINAFMSSISALVFALNTIFLGIDAGVLLFVVIRVKSLLKNT